MVGKEEKAVLFYALAWADPEYFCHCERDCCMETPLQEGRMRRADVINALCLLGARIILAENL